MPANPVRGLAAGPEAEEIPACDIWWTGVGFSRSSLMVSAMVTRQQIDGVGAVFVDDDGRIQLVVSDECADAFDAASAQGVTADDLVNALLVQAERVKAGAVGGRREMRTDDTGAPIFRVPSGSERSARRERWRNRLN